jgi:hypothetical protein
MEESKLGARTRRQRKLLAEARTPQPSDRKRKSLQGSGQPIRSTRGGGNAGKAFTKNLPRTGWMVTKHTPNNET